MNLSDWVRSKMGQSSERTLGAELWLTIWTVGGACWIAIALLCLSWNLSAGSTVAGRSGAYFIDAVLLLHFALLFTLSAGAYRIALGQGWPADGPCRFRVI